MVPVLVTPEDVGQGGRSILFSSGVLKGRSKERGFRKRLLSRELSRRAKELAGMYFFVLGSKFGKMRSGDRDYANPFHSPFR
jgi:hypothetical protein